MTTELIPLPKASITEMGATFQKSLTVDEWRDIGRRIERVRGAMGWILGDWFNAGKRFAGLPKGFHTEEEEAQAVTGLVSVDPLHFKVNSKFVFNCAYVCRRFPPAERVAELSFAHHQEVASMPSAAERRKWLKKAVANDWSVADMRAAIGGRDAQRPIRAFIPGQAVMETVRWFRVQFEETPLDEWEEEKREALREEFRPLREILEKL